MYRTTNFWNEFLKFWEKNPIYLLSSLIYYPINIYIMGVNFYSFLYVTLAYILCFIIAFTPLGEWLLRIIEKARPLETKKEREYILPLFEEVYQEAKQATPELGYIEICIIDNMTVNSSALGTHTIAITKGAIETFTEDELKAVLAHEIAHIVNSDTASKIFVLIGSGILSIFVLGVKLIINIADYTCATFKKNTGVFIVKVFRLFLQMFIFMATLIAQIAVTINSRSCEYRADMYVQKIGYGDKMIEALYMLEKLKLGENSGIIQRMTASHPRITARIERLENMNGQ